MTNSTQLLVKFPAEVRPVSVSFADRLVGGEVIISGLVGTSSPTGLTVSGTGYTDDSVELTVGVGADQQSYGVDITVNTDDGHVYVKQLAVVINSDIASNYQNVNDQAFAAIMGRLEVGTAALGTASFMFPAGFNANNGVVGWELVDADGIIHASGQAFDYQVEVLTSGRKVTAQALINAPSNLIPTLDGQTYQIRWTLTVGGQPYYSFESLEVTGANTVPVGTEDTVELADSATFAVSYVSDRPFDTVTVSVYDGNTQVITDVKANPLQVADGWQYIAEITNPVDTPLLASLEPYTLMWKMSNASRPNYYERSPGRLFVVNASLMSATEDMRLMVSKSRTSIHGTNDILFTVPILLSYLRRGRDAFNIAWGMFTGFTMLNAKGGIREYWLKFAEVMALRSQFLAEGEKVFNFSGQAISLEVDRTQFYQTLADNIQSYLDNEGKQVKQNLIKKGIISGDGDVTDLSAVRRGANGAVAITLTPATSWGKYTNRFNNRF